MPRWGGARVCLWVLLCLLIGQLQYKGVQQLQAILLARQVEYRYTPEFAPAKQGLHKMQRTGKWWIQSVAVSHLLFSRVSRQSLRRCDVARSAQPDEIGVQ